MHSIDRRVLWQNALLALAYFGTAWLGLQVATVGTQVTLLWAPAGIALAAVVLLGFRVAPGIAIGALAANLTTDSPLLFPPLVAAGNTLAALVGAFLVRLESGMDGRIRTPRDAIAFIVLGAGVSPVVSASVGACALGLSGIVPWSAWSSAWAEWWLGDAMGVLVVAAPLLAFTPRPASRASWGPWEALALLTALGLVGLLVFLQPGGAPYPLAFTLFPVTLWAAYRFESFGAALATLLVAALATAGTLAGHGPFVRETLSESVRLMWGFVAVVAGVGLVLGSLVAVRARAEAALRESRDRLRAEIRDRRRIEESLWRSERLASLGTFAAGMAHEINNPLGAILLAAHIAQDDPTNRDQVATALEDIVEETERSARVVRSVLQFAKAEATELTRLDLREPMRSATDHVRQLGIHRGIDIRLELPTEELPVRGNAVELEQALDNLLRNGVEASPDASCVRISARGEGGELLVVVRDEGRGMTPEEKARAFEPFYTTRGRHGGTGLGMSICHGIVEAHQGSIVLESGEGDGTVVTLTLPRHPGTDSGGPDGSRSRR
ncbi:MAG: MASE1 domain-containing protein [Myxococcota bacterium]